MFKIFYVSARKTAINDAACASYIEVVSRRGSNVVILYAIVQREQHAVKLQELDGHHDS